MVTTKKPALPKARKRPHRTGKMLPQIERLDLLETFEGINTPEVLEFLRQNPLLPPFLAHVGAELRGYFAAPPRLELLHDPEENCSQLRLAAQVTGEVAAELEALRHFDENWWLANASQVKGQLCVDVDFA